MDEPPTTKIPIDQASLFEMVGDEEPDDVIVAGQSLKRREELVSQTLHGLPDELATCCKDLIERLVVVKYMRAVIPTNTLYNGTSDVLESSVILHMEGYTVTLTCTFYEIITLTDAVKHLSLVGIRKTSDGETSKLQLIEMMHLAGKSAATRRHIRTLAEWMTFPLDLVVELPADSDDEDVEDLPEAREVFVFFLYRMLALEYKHTELASVVTWEDR